MRLQGKRIAGRRIMRTEKYLQDSLGGLLNKKSIEKIRINDIIESVGACKGTFYRYYQDKYQLLTSYFKTYLYDSVVSECHSALDFLTTCLEFFKANSKVFVNSFCSTDDSGVRVYHEKLLFEYFLKELVLPEKEEDALFIKNILRLYASNCTEIMLYWASKAPHKPISAVLYFMEQAKPLVLLDASKEKPNKKK